MEPWRRMAGSVSTSELRRGQDDALGQSVVGGEQAASIEGQDDQGDLIDARVAIALHGVEIAGLHVGADADLDVVARAAALGQDLIEPRDALGSLLGRAIEAVPPLAQVGDAAQGGVGLALI